MLSSADRATVFSGWERQEAGTALAPVFSYWREFGARYVTALCMQPGAETGQENVHVPRPSDEELDWIVLGARTRAPPERTSFCRC